MEKLKNIPSLRFPEFEGDWEANKLGEVFSIFNGYAFSSASSSDKGVLWVKIADVGIQEMKYQNLSYLPFSFKDKNKKFILKKGDFVVALTRPILNGKLKIAQINDFFDGALLNQRVGKIMSNNYHPFIFSLLQREDLIKSIENNIAGSDPPNLSPNEINSIDLSIPSFKEQTKIASFLTVVDDKLQALKQKKTLLEQYKKGVMQKIFSQELRFKDDNGNDYPDWEDKKLGDCLDYIQPTKYLVSSTEYDNTYSTPVLTAGKTFILGYTNETNGIFENNLPVIIFDDFTTATQFVDFPFKAKSSAMKILIANEGINIKFIYEAMEVMNYEVGGHERHWISKFAPLDISIPNHEEQTKIANFLSAIDDKINHCQSQIEKMEVWKKGLLQQMFV